MDEQLNQQRQPRRTTKKKSKLQIFKENQLPLLIVAAAALLILIFLIGSISNAVKRAQIRKAEEAAAAEQAALEKEALDQRIDQLMTEAATAALQYNYEKAIDLLDSVNEHALDYPQLQQIRDQYENAQSALVAWNDPSKVPNLSFQMLIASPEQAFAHEVYSTAFNRNYVTTEEFSSILAQLYNNGYVLVTTKDLFTTQTAEDGSIVTTANTIYLPAGKQPIMITQTNVNYNYYLVDSDNDMLPDGNACGFAHKLLMQGDRPVSEMVTQTGETIQGDYDLIPILESFVSENPDFSYRGSRAIVALTGYDGLFGYRTAIKDQERLGDSYNYEVDEAISVANTLRSLGYELACYTYRNIGYGDSSLEDVQKDLEQWNKEVAPLIGIVDTLVYAQRSDISVDTAAYTGQHYDLIKGQGFRHYLGFCNDGTPWATVTDDYARQGRLMVAGATMKHHGNWFAGIFDPSSVLDSTRGEIEEW